MEGGEKRKQPAEGEGGGDAVSGAKKRAREEEAVTEEEVEEFFAILRRIHVAIGHFRSSGGERSDRRELAAEGSRLRTMLEMEARNGVRDGGDKRDEVIEENLGLDLNARPGPDF